mmetsp:Transcript_29578/g.71468  ORF Transcript_29578/g.71468 Transcript_29578/m.71468 type:complete len:81 (-) Transcript_29578:128-370(-)
MRRWGRRRANGRGRRRVMSTRITSTLLNRRPLRMLFNRRPLRMLFNCPVIEDRQKIFQLWDHRREHDDTGEERIPYVVCA